MLEIQPVTADRWEDLAAFFGPSGAFSNCWCTWWRQTAADFSHGIEEQGAGNRSLMHEIVEAGSEPGLLAYRDGTPVGWISVAPRPQYGRILRSRRIGPAPEEAADERVWSVVCFWIPRKERGKGVANELLKGAVEHARRAAPGIWRPIRWTPPAAGTPPRTCSPARSRCSSAPASTRWTDRGARSWSSGETCRQGARILSGTVADEEATETARIERALEGVNAGYIAEMQERWRADPASVDPEWRALFEPAIPPTDGQSAEPATGRGGTCGGAEAARPASCPPAPRRSVAPPRGLPAT